MVASNNFKDYKSSARLLKSTDDIFNSIGKTGFLISLMPFTDIIQSKGSYETFNGLASVATSIDTNWNSIAAKTEYIKMLYDIQDMFIQSQTSHNLNNLPYLILNKIDTKLGNEDKHLSEKILLFASLVSAKVSGLIGDENFEVYNMLAEISFCLCLHRYSRFETLKNNQIKRVLWDEKELEILYGSAPVFSQSNLKNLFVFINSSIIGKSALSIQPKNRPVMNMLGSYLYGLQKTFFSINTVTDIVHTDSVLEDNKVLYFNDNLNNHPLHGRDDTKPIYTKSFSEILKDRRYLYSRNGVRVIFSEDSYISEILVKEDSNSFYYQLKVNVDGVAQTFISRRSYYSDRFDKKINCKSGVYNIELHINKCNLDSFDDYFFDGFMFGTIFIAGADKDMLLANIKSLLKVTTYICFCNPRFTTSTQVKPVEYIRCEGDSRISSYRVAHIRRLPNGYASSEEAKSKAKANGFDCLPDGFTFVSAANESLEDIADTVEIVV